MPPPVHLRNSESTAQNAMQAPPVYRPQIAPQRPPAPSVYRPQPGASQLRGTLPPVYSPRAQAPPALSLVPKQLISGVRIGKAPHYNSLHKATTSSQASLYPPPVYRPDGSPTVQSRTSPSSFAGRCGIAAPTSSPVPVQRKPAPLSVPMQDFSSKSNLSPPLPKLPPTYFPGGVPPARPPFPPLQRKPSPSYLAEKVSPPPATVRPHAALRTVQRISALTCTHSVPKTPLISPRSVGQKVVQRMHGKQPSPRTQPIPVFTLNPHQSEFEQLYRMPDSPELAYVDELSHRLHQAIHINSDLMNPSSGAKFPSDIQDEYWNTLERYRGLHIGSVPALKEGWVDIHDSYSGAKVGGALYADLRTKFKHVLNESDVDFTSHQFVRKYPEVHHLLYKAIRPEYAAEEWNLMVATRGNSSQEGQHDGIFHKLSAARMGGIYTTLVPAAERLLESWADHKPSLYPSWTQQPSFFSGVVEEWSSVHRVPPTPVFSLLAIYPRRCGAITRSGKQCSRLIYSGTYCHQHTL
jgi:hypothetical protein